MKKNLQNLMINCYYFLQDGTLKSDLLTNDMIPDLGKVLAATFTDENTDSPTASTSPLKSPLLQNKIDVLSPVLDFLEGKHCLTGVSSCH